MNPSRSRSADGVAADDHRVVCHLDRLLDERGMTLVELAARTDITVGRPLRGAGRHEVRPLVPGHSQLSESTC